VEDGRGPNYLEEKVMLLKKGAEANLYLEPFAKVLHAAGRCKVIVKQRILKGYRIKELDERLRRSRTSLEAKLLADAKRAGVPTPAIYEVDLQNTRIVMEFIEGAQVKQVLNDPSFKNKRKLYRLIGRFIARLHKAGMVHGDLTTSNMILTKNGELYFVDFGLGEYNPSVEARGVDIHLLKRALQSVHFRIVNEVYREVLRNYRSEFGKKSGEVIKRAEEIERRGRYVAREERIWR
jgi:TP53 regulating kinase-like protein